MLVTELKYIKGRGYYFGEKTFYSPNHLGIDYPINQELLEFPVDLVRCTFTDGEQGGLTVTGTDKAGYIHRFMHLASFGTLESTIKAGTTFARSGNTGKFSTAPHLHWDCRKPNQSTLQFKNFINPDDWKKEILPNLLPMSIPNWFKDNGTDKWAKDKFIRIDQSNLTEADCKELESLKKQTQPAEIEVSIHLSMLTLTKQENEALELAIREATRFYIPYVSLLFKKPVKLNIGSLVRHASQVKGFTPQKGLNVIIADDKEVDKVANDNVNGIMFTSQRTCVIQRSLLLKEDSKNRSIVNHFSATLIHELMHWFGAYLDFETRTDRTHDYDYEKEDSGYYPTLANYLPKLAWGLLHDKNFRTTNKI